jgi:hypothetical protein
MKEKHKGEHDKPLLFCIVTIVAKKNARRASHPPLPSITANVTKKTQDAIRSSLFGGHAHPYF